MDWALEQSDCMWHESSVVCAGSNICLQHAQSYLVFGSSMPCKQLGAWVFAGLETLCRGQ